MKNFGFAPLLKILSFLFICVSISHAQWTNIGPSPTSGLTSLYYDNSTNNLFVGTFEGFHYYSIASSTWTSHEDVGWIGRTVHSIISHSAIPGRIITGRENAFFKGYVEISNDWGITNSVVYSSNGGGVTDIKNIPGNPDKFFACTWSDVAPGELLRSTDGGQNWSLLSNYLHYNMTEIAPHPSDSNIIYVSGDALVTRTTDGGITWDSVDTGLPQMLGVYCVSINPASPGILVCSNDNGIYRTTNAGGVWTQVDNHVCRHIEHNPANPNIAAGVTFSPYTIIISYDAGATWSDYSNGYPGGDTQDLAFSGNGLTLFIASQNSGVYSYPFNPVPVELIYFSAGFKSGKIVLSWKTATETNNRGFELFRDETDLTFIPGHGTSSEIQTYTYEDINPASGINNYRLYQVDYDGTRTEIASESVNTDLIPDEFTLEQNYPNPFNPATTIKYAVPSNVKGEKSNVKLVVYDMLGRIAAVLVDNEQKEAGIYTVEFDGSELSSGIYLYTLTAGDASLTKKMMLLK